MQDEVAVKREYQLLDIRKEGDVLVVMLKRPEKRNAINDAMIGELETCFTEEIEDARAVVLHGAGEHFSAGLDLMELMQKRSPNVLVGMRRSRQWHRVFDFIQFGEVPVVSVLKGGVIGGGFELAAATHVRVSEASTFFQLPEGQRGIFLGGSGSVRIPRLIGASRVVEMMLTGRTLSAEEGQSLGISHYVVADGEGLAKAMTLATAIATNLPTSNYAIINGISRISEMPMGDGMFAETMVTAMTRSAAAESSKRIQEFFAGRKDQRSESDAAPGAST